MKTGIFAGLWDVLPCTIKAKYVCKQRAEGASLTTVAPTLNPNRCKDGWYPLGSIDYCAQVRSHTYTLKSDATLKNPLKVHLYQVICVLCHILFAITPLYMSRLPHATPYVEKSFYPNFFVFLFLNSRHIRI